MTSHSRAFLPVPPASVIRKLPLMGRLMITAKQNGATHERIGVVETVTDSNGWLACGGTDHDSRIDPSLITSMIVDRTSVRQGQIYPRIDFRQGDTVAFSVVGFDGIDRFDAALAEFGEGEPLSEAPRQPRPERADAHLDQTSAMPFEAARSAARRVEIHFRRAGFEQSWAGIIESVKPAVGFINVMRSDFHLHLLGDAVAAWEAGRALDAEGNAIGLYLTTDSPSEAL